jgi:hypothetical protein
LAHDLPPKFFQELQGAPNDIQIAEKIRLDAMRHLQEGIHPRGMWFSRLEKRFIHQNLAALGDLGLASTWIEHREILTPENLTNRLASCVTVAETAVSALESLGWRRSIDMWMHKPFDGIGEIRIEVLIRPMFVHREFGIDVREKMIGDDAPYTYLMGNSFKGTGFFDVRDMSSPAMSGLLVFDEVVCARFKQAQAELQNENCPAGELDRPSDC